VYCFGLDMALLARAAFPRRIPLVYEIGDLRTPGLGPVAASVATALERSVARRASILVTTSPGFVDEHLRNLIPQTAEAPAIVVLENKLPSHITTRFPRRQPGPGTGRDRIRLGFVGLLRYPRTILPVLEAVAGRPDRFEFHVFGDGQLRPAVQEIAARAPNVLYCGSFRNPDDLGRIYASIDLNYVVYDNADVNVRLAIPNKLYESLYFGVPLVVSSRTRLAERVHRYQAGFVVDPDEARFAERFLADLNPAALRVAAAGALAVPTADLLSSDQPLQAALATVQRT
jgi:glycosyltransferase involved in cell wall biosynthesis